MEVTLVFTPIEIIVMVVTAPISAGAYYLIKQWMNRPVLIKSGKDGSRNKGKDKT